jgi:hypothetical protein
MADMEEVTLVVAHHERATVRVGDVFLKIDADQTRTDVEVEAMAKAGPGDALYDLASLTLGHQEHLGDVVAGYGADVDLDVIRAWWSLRSLRAVRWLVEHGFDPSSPGCEVDVLRSQMSGCMSPMATSVVLPHRAR